MNEFENENVNLNGNEEVSEPKVEEPVAEAALNEEPTPKAEAPVKDEPTFSEIPFDDEPSFNRVNYTEVAPAGELKNENRGLKIFALIMVCVIILSGTCAAGYFAGKNSVSRYSYSSTVELDLASKPKNEEGMTAAQIYAEVNESIVGIRVYNATTIKDASGVIYSKDGYIITNDHIYDGITAAKFKVYMHDGSEREATYVAGDSISDLAILKLKDTSNLKPAVFGDSRELVYGEPTVAVGRPNGAMEPNCITEGIISLTKRRVTGTSNYSSSLIQTDSAINPGSSGGALLNMYGQVVGITSSKMTGDEYDAIGFAIPTVTVKRVANQLIKDGKVKDRAKLGITYSEITSVYAEINDFDATGIYVVTVSETSDAYGKLNKNDLITHINGIEITCDDIVLDIIEESKAGDTLTLTVIPFNGSAKEVKVKLGANVNESSYVETEQETDDEESFDGTFDFPQGE
ncbi:MAG: trypsin-like peptidase domain-containing protein [Clostridia bacterium]|nr:trypsin-like peptidase domain-containing protein [Clostridia bacterium]